MNFTPDGNTVVFSPSDNLIADAVVEESRSPCKATTACKQMGGCPRCFAAVMKGDIGVESVTVYRKTGIIRLILNPGCGKAQPCEIAFAGVPINVQG